MGKRYILTALVLLFLFSHGGQCNEYTGYLVRVLTPNTVMLEVGPGQEMKLRIVGPDFGYDAELGCDESEATMLKCENLIKILEGKPLGIVIEETDGEKMSGDIVVDKTALSLHLVREGYYRVDYNYNRSLALIEAESEARCHYLKRWAVYQGNYEFAQSCMVW